MKHIGTLAIIAIAALFSLGSCSHNFDIDKEGGIKTTIEVSQVNFLKALSNHCQDPTFNEALIVAYNRHWENDGDFFTLFEEAIKEKDPNTKLAPFFLYEFKDCININSSNEEVLDVLRTKYKNATYDTQDILNKRLDRYFKAESTLFNKKKYNVKLTETPGRILIEYAPNVNNDDIVRLRKLIYCPGNLEFWETYNYDELRSCFEQANAALAEEVESADNPLFDLLKSPNYDKAACMGYVQIRDTAYINQMLYETKELFPRNLKLAWTFHPEDHGDGIKCLELIALKKFYDNSCAMDGSHITEAKQETNKQGFVEVSLKMDPEGIKLWKRLTGENIGKQIAIVLDGYVFSYPVVNCEIPNGRCSIASNLTVEEAQDIANILQAGKYPFDLRILDESLVEPKGGK